MTWQEFSGKYIQKDKEVVAICGTHGKSSTTAMIGLMMEHAQLDPIVEVGTIVNEWGAGYRIANSKYFVCEADEFNNNFLNYNPSYLVINNIEMDHPEFFNNIGEIRKSYIDFIRKLINQKILIVNFNNEGIRTVLEMTKEWILNNDVKIYGYCTNINNIMKWINANIYIYKILEEDIHGTSFSINNEISFHIGIPGIHNVQNAMSAYCLAKALNIDDNEYSISIDSFHGISRRLDKKYDENGIVLFDDYAHHPTEIRAILNTIKHIYKTKKIVAIFEPHQISRFKLFIDEFVDAFKIADEIIVTKTYIGREISKNIEPLDIKVFIEKVKKKTLYIEEFNEVEKYVIDNLSNNEVIIVFGAGYSYKLTQKINESLRNRVK